MQKRTERAELKCQFECKNEDDSVGLFKGVASTNDADSDGDVIEAGCFDPIPMKTGPGGELMPNVLLLRDHDRTQIIGGWKSFIQNGNELQVEGELCLAVPKAEETHALMKRGYLSGLSVCFTVSDRKHISVDQKSGRRHIRKATLRECSIVGFPANANARITSVKDGEPNDVDAWLIERGLASGDLEKLLRAFKQNGFEDEPLRSRIGRYAIVPRDEESRDDFMTRCLRKTGGDMEACATVWDEKSAKQNGNGNGGDPPEPGADEDEAEYLTRCLRDTNGDMEGCLEAWDEYDEENSASEGRLQVKSRYDQHLLPRDKWTSRALKEADPKKPWGDVDYADPGYQEDGVHRYPIDVVWRIRAAWNRIHQEANREPYTRDQLQRIEARIVAAWKKRIDPDGPPAYQERNSKGGKPPNATRVLAIDGHGIIDANSVAATARELMAQLGKRAQR